MSSSLQKNHLIENKKSGKEGKVLPCPECSELTMKYIQSDCTLEDDTFIPNLRYLYCSNCQSKFYDDNAMQVIESYRYKK